MKKKLITPFALGFKVKQKVYCNSGPAIVCGRTVMINEISKTGKTLMVQTREGMLRKVRTSSVSISKIKW